MVHEADGAGHRPVAGVIEMQVVTDARRPRPASPRAPMAGTESRLIEECTQALVRVLGEEVRANTAVVEQSVPRPPLGSRRRAVQDARRW